MRTIRVRNVILAAFALSAGWLTLFGYFFPDLPLLVGVRQLLIGWAVLLAAVAVWAGVFNLLRVHLNKLFAPPRNLYSLFVIIGFLVALAASFGTRLNLGEAPGQFVFRHIVSASGAALSALFAFILLLAGFRLLRRPLTLTTGVFVVTAVVGVFSLAPRLVGMPDLGEAGGWLWIALSQVFAVAGGRGLLLGIALGIVATGVRLLLALERPYGD